MAPKSKKQKAAEGSYANNRDGRRTRKNESECVQHLHDELLKAGECIEELRADRDKKAAECKEVRSSLSKVEKQLEDTVDVYSYGGPIRSMRQKIYR